MTNIHTATVETLTAEVRVLQMDARQITLSIYKQLDCISVWEIRPFGRVRTGRRYQTHWDGFKEEAELEVVGADSEGRLVRACTVNDGYGVPGIKLPHHDDLPGRKRYEQKQAEWKVLRRSLNSLPLIVLAGSR